MSNLSSAGGVAGQGVSAAASLIMFLPNLILTKSMHLSIETVKTQRKKAKHILRERYKLLFNIIGIFL